MVLASNPGLASRSLARIAGALLVVIATGCEPPVADAIAGPRVGPDPIAPLHALERALRTAQLAPAPPPERTSGSNPVDIAAIGDHAVGVLAGDDAIVVLDAAGLELDRAPAPAGARALAVTGDRIVVGGALSSRVARYRLRRGRLVAEPGLEVPGASIAAIAAHPGGAVYTADLVDGGVRWHAAAGGATRVATCRGAARGVALSTAVAFACVLDHRALIIPVDSSGRPRAAPIAIELDGPLWSIAMAADGDHLLVAIGGAEDHPLDRSRGFFGHIDSFAYVYRVAAGATTRLAAINLSEYGVVTPKWLAVRRDRARIVVDAAGFGGGGWSSLAVSATGTEVVGRRSLPAGIQAMATAAGVTIAANPLLDAWVIDSDPPRLVAVPARHATELPPSVRLGELLFFTTALAPAAISDGAHSRFTCETCHWEGYADGRVHYTGRDQVHASTRALRGLVQVRPYFSRANDRTLAGMVHAEFGVASRGTHQPSWFTLDATAVPWLAAVPGLGLPVNPLAQRAAFMAFLGHFGHETNPRVGTRTAFAPIERRGAAVFRDRCEPCHQARLLVDDAGTRVAFAGWERHVMSASGALTWASEQRWKTGVVPYVHADGARVSPLRRLYRKHPYFTSGVAGDLGDVIARVRIGAGPGELLHDGEAAGRPPLPADEREPLLAFLRLL